MTGEALSDSGVDAERLAKLASALPDVEYILRLEPDRAFEYVSDSVISLVGYTPQEHYDDPDLANRLVDPRDLHVLAEAAQVPPGETMEYTLRWIARDGRRVWTYHRCRIHARQDGAQVLYGVARDVTPFKEAEARYRLLAEHATDVVVTGDTNGVLQWVSESITALLGWQPTQWVGRPFPELVHPADRALLPPLQQELQVGDSEAFEVRLADSGGGYRWVDVRATPLVDEEGMVIGRVAGWRDITEQRATQDELAESETRFRLLAENAADVVMLLGPHNQPLWLSPSWHRQFGYDTADLGALGREDFVHVDDLQRVASMVSTVQSGAVDAVTEELRLYGKDGSCRWWSVTLRRSSPTHFVVAFRDVDERVRGRQLIEAEERRRTTALETMIDPFIVVRTVRDAAGQIVDLAYNEVNRAACAYLGADRTEILGSRMLVRDPVQATSELFDEYVGALVTQTPLVLDAFAIRAEQGQDRRYLDIRAVPVDADTLSLTWRDVTDRVEADARVREAEQKYRLLAENSSDVVALVDLHGQVDWVSASLSSALGWVPQDLVGVRLADFVHPDDVEQARLTLRDHGADVEFRLIDASGEYHWISAVSRAVSEGDVRCYVIGLRDICERMEIAQQIVASEERLQLLIDSLIEPFVLLDAVRDDRGTVIDFRFADANPSALSVYGMSRDQLLGQLLSVLHPAAKRTGLFDMYVAVVDDGTPMVLDDWPYPQDIFGGQVLHYDVRAVRVGDAVSQTWRDVTERYEVARRIAESEEQFRLLAENSSDVVMRSTDGRLAWVAPSLTRMLGWSPDDWIGHALAEFAHPADLELARLGDVENDGGRTTTRLRMRAKDGGYHWVEVHANKVPETLGGKRGIVASLRTIDDVVAYEAELQRRATFDDLTGALKRDEAIRLLTSMASYWRDPGRESAVLFCDIDGFKQINDTYGHVSGDRVLRTVADRIRGAVRTSDVLARMGGDEFLVVLDGIHDMAEALRIAEQIRASASAPISAMQRTIRVTLSIGVILRKPGEDPDELISRADTAMYAAKRAGRDRVVAAE